MKVSRVICISLFVLCLVYAQNTSITINDARLVPKLMNYQGYLTDTFDIPINDTLDMTFKIFDAVSSGNELWSETQTNVPVERGVFSVLLGGIAPIPDSVFADFTSTWLELTLEGPQILTPRTRITSVGYAYTATYSDTAEYARVGADNDWTVTDSVLYTGNYWGLARGGASNVLYGDSAHTHTNLGIQSTTGASGQHLYYCTVGGGVSNTAGKYHATVGGGRYNVASGTAATVSGGDNNDATHDHSTVGGGQSNTAGNVYATIGGGVNNTVTAWDATVGGGRDNTISGYAGVIAGGYENSVAGDFSAILGGRADTITATADYSYLFGITSKLTQDSTFMVDMPHIRFGDEVTGYEFPTTDGSANKVMMTDGSGQLSWSDAPSDNDWTLSGSVLYPSGDYGLSMRSSNMMYGSQDSTHVCFGVACTTGASGEENKYCTVSGGFGNNANHYYATVNGGYINTASGLVTYIGGGAYNIANYTAATIAGGMYNTASGYGATVPGGQYNTASGENSFAAGNRAKANHNGAFVWSGNASTDFTSTASNQFLIRATGGVGIGTANPQDMLHVAGGNVIVDSAVGIGVTNPSQKLEVNGNVKIAATDSYLDFGSDLRQAINFWPGSANALYGIGMQDYTQYFRAAGNFAWFIGGTHTDSELNPGTGGSVAMVIARPNNYVGIGTTSPSEKLEVNGNAYIAGDLTWQAETSYISIPAAAFECPNNISQYVNSGWRVDCSTNSPPAGYFTAPAQLPHNCTVTKLTFYWSDLSTANNGALILQRSNMDGSIYDMASTSTSGNSGYGSSSDATISYAIIDNSQYTYFLTLNVAADIDIKGLAGIIEYVITRPY